jgi:RNA ligase
VNLSDLLDLDALEKAIADGNVRVQTHPGDDDLRIYNYTEQAQWSRTWDEVTTQCRGLIVCGDEVIARPWAKFFNYGEHPEGALDLRAPSEVTDKKDGSLGILYEAPDGLAIATRGSFASEQAIHATEVLRERYADAVFESGWTYLFEIVYPENRIVLDYGDLDDLILLGAVSIETGRAVGPNVEWPGRRTEMLPYSCLAEALSAPVRPNAEGLVVRYVASGLMVKIKQDDYVALHRIITGLNARVVWEEIGNGRTVQDLCEPLPDEFHAWVKEVADGLNSEAARIYDAAVAEHRAIQSELGDIFLRKDYAIRASRSPLKSWLFLLLDGNDPWPRIWHSLKPSGAAKLITRTEDAA